MLQKRLLSFLLTGIRQTNLQECHAMAAPIARFANVCLITGLFVKLFLLNWIGMFVKPSGSELAQFLRIFVL